MAAEWRFNFPVLSFQLPSRSVSRRLFCGFFSFFPPLSIFRNLKLPETIKNKTAKSNNWLKTRKKSKLAERNNKSNAILYLCFGLKNSVYV
jgi:hypothetical protein